MSFDSKPKVKDHLYTSLMKKYRQQPWLVPGLNFLIRLILRWRFAFYRVDVYLYGRDRQEALDQFYQNKKIFFGLAIIRSGTTFLSNFLNETVPDAIVRHEAIVDDYWSFANNYHSAAGTLAYVRDFRRPEIFYRLRHAGNFKVYGEINPFLRRHAAALKKIFPQAKFFHLVRDGREVVRSIMCRATFDAKEPIKDMIKPVPDSPWFARWPQMSRFEKVCWLWQSDNKYLRETIGYTVKFEKLVSDYNYFQEKFLAYLGLTVSQDDWRCFAGCAVNESQQYKFPSCGSWTEEQKKQFWEICGEEMMKNGYEPEVDAFLAGELKP